jgi:hypothetical protein
MRQLRLVGIAHVDPPVIFVVQADARVSVSKFRLLLVVLIGIPREPCGDHSKGQQQDEPDMV